MTRTVQGLLKPDSVLWASFKFSFDFFYYSLFEYL